jgi:predicted HTH transcriptional regulator
MWPFASRLEDLQAQDVTRLVEDRVRESSDIELKRQMYGGSDSDIREMLRDVASMANADGGVILIGVDEDGEGTATAIVPQKDGEKQAARLVSSCLASLAERVPGLQARPVAVHGGDVIVVRIPKSYRKPHMITFGGATDFWIRHDRQKSRMSIAEVRSAISATEDLEMKAAAYIEYR